MAATERSSRPGRSLVATTTETRGRSVTSAAGQHETHGLGAGRAEAVDQPGQVAVPGTVAGDHEHGDAVLRLAYATLVGVRRRRVHDHDARTGLIAQRAQPHHAAA